MRESGRIAASLEVLADFEQRRVPLKVALADWARGARYAGSKDRAFISGLCLDVLRKYRSLGAIGGGARVSVAATLVSWGRTLDEVGEAFAEEPHGPGALTDTERKSMDGLSSTDGAIAADVPDFCWPMLDRVSDNPVGEGQASASRAPFDTRTNILKASTEKVSAALTGYTHQPCMFAVDGIRFSVPSAGIKAPQLNLTPAYNKGWLEVQDEGSQIAALAAGPLEGRQVLDYCAGGGGKTLALASLMANTGQIYAYDSDPHRLAPIFDRLARAGVRNAQVVSPAQNAEQLDGLKGKMDCVFVDAPCSGSGTWRRRPDTKWRLTEDQLARRMDEQDAVLAAAAGFVAPGGSLVYVTCSLFAEENEDRIASFLKNHSEFEVNGAIEAISASGRLNPDSVGTLTQHVSPSGTLRLSPLRTETDGFGITRLIRRSK